MFSLLKSSLFAFALVSGSAFAADQYAFDAGHSEITAQFNHAGISTQTIKFERFDGEILLDKGTPSQSSVDIRIDINSVRSNIAAFDEHLKSDDFFDTAQYPEATFKSTAVKQTGANRYHVTGDLTIKGKTHPITLVATKTFDDKHPFKPAHYFGFHITGDLLRSDFDLGKYTPLNSDHVKLIINIELAQKAK